MRKKMLCSQNVRNASVLWVPFCVRGFKFPWNKTGASHMGGNDKKALGIGIQGLPSKSDTGGPVSVSEG